MSRLIAEPVDMTSRLRRYLIHDGSEAFELWWEFHSSGFVPSPTETLDHLAIAALPYAMTERKNLHIRGPVTRAMLAQLEDYQEAWSLFHRRFHRISISAEQVVGEPRPPKQDLEIPSAVVAYSGGLDANYAVVAHREKLLRYREAEPRYAVLVHGFDIPLSSAAGFDRAMARARAMLEPEQVELVPVRTNWREILDPGWTMVFGAAIASTLHQFSGDVDRALMGSGLPYNQQRVPWGTNPVTDPMLGRTGFPFVTVGLGSTRVQKAQILAGRAAVLENLRVCWEGDTYGVNCGVCEKCIRTKLTFIAAGAGVIPALGPVSEEQVESIELRALAQRLELEELLDYEQNLGPTLTAAVTRVLRRYSDADLP